MEARLLANGDFGNGNHFLTLLKTEASRLNTLVRTTEEELNDESIPEEVRGKMRVAVGKAKMLLQKKFCVFEDLCLKNVGINANACYPVTSEDLAGYWDTIVLQIIQIYNMFDEVETSRKNNWQEPNGNPKKIEQNLKAETPFIH